jgi:GTP pyrophosphokinase
VLNNNIYCFTPKGDVIELTKGATPIDFAYKIHTKIGETMVGAIVNDQAVPFDYELQNNDIVKINTNKSAKPSREWINIVKSTQTRNKIKNYFTKNDREIYIEKGKYLLEKALRKRKLPVSDFLSNDNLKTIRKEKEYKDLKTVDDVYLTIGNEKNNPNSIINVIYKDETQKPAPKTLKLDDKALDADIIVAGIDKVKVNLAHCCNPVYGDEIIGYITKGNGISVHRINCHNLEDINDRTVDVTWNSNVNKKYLSYLLIYSTSRENRMAEIVQAISLMSINIEEIKVLNKDANYIYELSLYVSGTEQLAKIINILNNNKYIENVERSLK